MQPTWLVLAAMPTAWRPTLRATSQMHRHGLLPLHRSVASRGRCVVSLAGGRGSAAVADDQRSEPKPSGVVDLQPPRGTRDFYPKEMALRNWLFGHWRDVAALHGFEEYDAPVLESEDLYVRKAGEEVSEQLYNMEDRSGRRLSLRPEMTPSLARMVLAKRAALPLPLKWFSIPQCWRYERTTRGRRREHYQWNMDVWGVGGLEAEAELLSAAVTFMRRVGLTASHVGIKVSTRRVLGELLARAGVPADKFASTCVLVDKLDKIGAPAVAASLVESGMAPAAADDLLAALTVSDFPALEAALGATSPALAELRRIFDLAEAYGYADWLVLDVSVVRGLAYYTGIVFEGFDRSGELRAIFGGGRYDELLGTFGGENLPAAGFGFGDAVIVELLKTAGALPELGSSAAECVVVPTDEALRGRASALAASLRGSEVSADLVLEPKKMKWIFKHAERVGAAYAVLLFPDETEKGLARVKRLDDAEQFDVPFDELPGWIAQRRRGDE